MLHRLIDDVRHGARILTKSPGLSLTAALLVALVVGGNTTVYSMINGLARRPAPGVTRPDLLSFAAVGRGDGLFFTPDDYTHYAAQSKTLRLAAYGYARSAVATPDGSHLLGTVAVTGNYFDTIGVRPSHGRAIGRSDDDEGAPLVAVISDRLWITHFNGDAGVVGRALSINGAAATIVGIGPPKFLGLSSAEATDVWVPMRRAPQIIPINDVALIGRPADASSLKDIRNEINVLHARLQAALPAPGHRAIRVSPYAAAAGTGLVDFQREIVATVSVLTLLTLLVVSANVANLMLARAAAQQRDTAVRQSLGASRFRIARLVLVEGVSIAAVACAAAFALAWSAARLIPRMLPAETGLEVAATDFAPDWRVALYAVIVSLIGAVFFTMVPALRAWRQDPLPTLKDGGPTSAPGRSWVSSGLVVLQIAFSALLLTIGGLAYRSSSLMDADAGFDAQRLLLVGVSTAAAAPTPEAHAVAIERIHQRLRAVPGFAAVSYVAGTAPFSWPRRPVTTTDRQTAAPPIFARLNAVAPDYLDLLGLTPVAGRSLAVARHSGGDAQAVISRSLADALFPGESAVGRTLSVGENRRVLEIVGVAPNASYSGRLPQQPGDWGHHVLVAGGLDERDGNPFVPPQAATFFIRYTGSLQHASSAIPPALADVDPRIALAFRQDFVGDMQRQTVGPRMIAVLLVLFAGVSLTIAAIGQYAAVAFNMRRRTREFGVRIALGASAGQVLASVLREGGRLTAGGLAAGFALSAGVATLLRGILFGITPMDLSTYLVVLALLAFVSLIACYLPARRASRVDPIQALRQV